MPPEDPKDAKDNASAGHANEHLGKARQLKSLVQFFRESPLVGLELDLERDKDEGREIQL